MIKKETSVNGGAESLKARRRPQIGLTANILWQIWKRRNKREYEDQARHQPLKVVQNAQVEWLEQTEAEMTRRYRWSTLETATTQEEQETDQGAVTMRIATEGQKGISLTGELEEL